MAKIIDNYVLEKIIGQGQFGEVYRGYNKTTNVTVAVKAINRAKIRGKCYELLENEIKVLRSCDNPNIIHLYDIKKTNNNIYLMLEFCNEGDLMHYLKAKKKLVEEEAIDIFAQICNAFKYLVKNKIMHRDFKLANILRHNGLIKIADFGFAKILGDEEMTKTTLGSPLNMAPEVILGSEYNSKADIWSIGACFYELLFGRPPYIADSTVELLKNIRKNPFKLPDNAKVSPEVEDVLMRMMKYDPKERLQWEELFDHPIHRIQESRILKELELATKNFSIFNICRFYIHNNRVIEDLVDIERRKDINTYAYTVAKTSQAEKFTGNAVNKDCRDPEEPVAEPQKVFDPSQSSIHPIEQTEMYREKVIQTIKENTSRILHERNKYVFLASVGEEAIDFAFKFSDLLVFGLIKKLFRKICEIKSILESGQNSLNLEMWKEYLLSKDYKKVCNYIFREYDMFKKYYEDLRRQLESKDLKNPHISKLLGSASEDELQIALREIVRVYVENVLQSKPDNFVKRKREVFLHFNKILDCLNSEEVFFFEKDSRQFNFRLVYEEFAAQPLQQIIETVQSKLEQGGVLVREDGE
mgnify:CR=1 FL=1